MLQHLADCYGVTLLLSTATQPALAARAEPEDVETLFKSVYRGKSSSVKETRARRCW